MDQPRDERPGSDLRLVCRDVLPRDASRMGWVGNVDFPQLRNRWRLGLEAFQGGDAGAERDQRAYFHLSVLCLLLDRHIAAPGEAPRMKKDG